MAIDIRKGLHVSSFPTLIASMMGTFNRVYNIILVKDTDNGQLSLRGDYLSYDNYEQADVADDDVEVVIRELGADGRYIVEVTELPEEEVLYLYNSPVSEYETKDLYDESLFYNKKGDTVQFVKSDGTELNYKVKDVRIVSPKNLMKNIVSSASSNPQLTLVTCATEHGKGYRRLVICVPA